MKKIDQLELMKIVKENKIDTVSFYKSQVVSKRENKRSTNNSKKQVVIEISTVRDNEGEVVPVSIFSSLYATDKQIMRGLLEYSKSYTSLNVLVY